MECGVYCENFIMIGLKADAGDNFKKRASIPLAPCIYAQVIYFVSGVVTRSVLFILCPPDLRGGRSVLTRHLSSGLHMLYVNMMRL